MFGCLSLGMIYWSVHITTVESNLRTSWSWNVICIMDWAFAKPSTKRARFLPYHAYPQWRNCRFEPGGQSVTEEPTGHRQGVNQPKSRKRLRNDREFLDVVDAHTRFEKRENTLRNTKKIKITKYQNVSWRGSVFTFSLPGRAARPLATHQLRHCLSYILFNRPVVGKTALLRQKSQQTHYYYITATKLAKHINICCCSFNQVSMKKKKTLLQENFDLTINFDLMINFDFYFTK